MAAMRNWLQGEPKEKGRQRVAVVHCKAGKGRSGTVACSYLISQEGWRLEDALKRFTVRRMRAGFGEGVSIPSQLRWVRYVNTWTNQLQKKYIERPVEVVEVHVWGLRSGVKVCVEGFIDEGRRIKNFHTFVREEKIPVDDGSSILPVDEPPAKKHTETLVSPTGSTPSSSKNDLSTPAKEASQNVILRPSKPLRLETSDINIDFERRNKSTYTGFAMVTAIAHVWFNVYFEGGASGNESGVFEIDWEAMDGIKGSARKGIKCLDKLKVVWKYSDAGRSQSIDEPKIGEPIKEGKPANWRGNGDPENDIENKDAGGVNSGRAGGAALTLGQMTSKDLGLRESDVASADVSRASSVIEQGNESRHLHGQGPTSQQSDPDNDYGVKSDVTEEHGQSSETIVHESHDHDRQDTTTGKYLEIGIAKVSTILAKMKGSENDHQVSKEPS
ncbi:Telomerase protein component 1 [Lithohypha guttulata]|nr:Telomerase protein component 1 [Lithohypha guttulata]